MCILCERFKPHEGRAGAPSFVQNSPVTLIECPRCGKYSIEEEMIEDFTGKGGLPADIGLALSGLAREATEHRKRLDITYDNYEKLAASAPVPRTYSARVDWLLLEVARRCPFPGQVSEQTMLEPIAALAYLPLKACDALLYQVAEEGLIGITDRDPLRYRVFLKPSGWARVDALQVTRPHSDRAFVAMGFAPELKLAYDDGIRKALEDCGFQAPFRVDDHEHEADADKPHFKQRIDDRIMAGIQGVGLVVVDVTLARPAVYFEAGFAQGLGIRIIWTCREDRHEDMCFDTRQNGHILWTGPADLREKLTNRIRARGWHPKVNVR